MLGCRTESTDWPSVFLHFACLSHLILNMVWQCKLLHVLVLSNPSLRDEILNIAILLGRKMPAWLA